VSVQFCRACGGELPAGCSGAFKGVPGCLMSDAAAAMERSKEPTGYQPVRHDLQVVRVGTEDDGEYA
jgi:hypothetical protein